MCVEKKYFKTIFFLNNGVCACDGKDAEREKGETERGEKKGGLDFLSENGKKRRLNPTGLVGSSRTARLFQVCRYAFLLN